MPKSALILFAHGARDPLWADPIRRVAELARVDGARVEVAFLEFIVPDLASAVACLAHEGYRRIVILPMFIASGGHLKRDLPEQLTRLRDRYPEISFVLEIAVGEASKVQAAMAASAMAMLGES